MALYNFQGLRFLFCCLVCIPAACFLFLIPMVFSCTVSVEARRQSVTRTEPVTIKVAVENGGWFPVSGVAVRVSWKAPGEKEVKAWKKLRGIGRNAREELLFELSASHCGRACFQVTKAGLFDYLGLFSLPVKRRQESVEIDICPIITPILSERMAYDPWLLGSEREGDIFLRDYLPGDRLHRIYWKLSAKDDNLQIRDVGRGGFVRIFLDFSPEFSTLGREWDEYLDRACSLFHHLVAGVSSPCTVEAVWRRNGSHVKFDISDIADLQTWTSIMLGEDTRRTPSQEEEVLMQGEALCLREDCVLYFGEQCVYG